jgi:PKHD-type hydroxylase
MVNTNEWFIFDADSIDKKTCNKIKRWASKKWEPSAVDTSEETTDEERKTGKKGDYKPDSKTRISDVIWTNDQWIYDTIWPWMLKANEEAGWKYDIDSAESMQITRYKKGGFYTWHKDGDHDHLSAYTEGNEFTKGKVRKLSMSVLLNDNFEGGEFEVMSYGKGETLISRPFENPKAGQIIVFPSREEHRVAPVTKGTRYSAVVWFLGPPMR